MHKEKDTEKNQIKKKDIRYLEKIFFFLDKF